MRYLAVFLLVAVALSPIIAHADATENTEQTTCPVTGHAVDKHVYQDYQGKRVYFCCESCVEEFNKDPESYMEKLKAEGVVLEAAPKAQTKCPVMGGDINKEVYSDYEGKRVYFCCENCKGEFAKDPAKYIEKLEADGVVLERVSEPSKTKKGCGPCPFKKTCGSGTST